MRRAVTLTAVLATLALAEAEPPSDHTRQRIVVCAGDSNTSMRNSWCDMLDRELPAAEWRFINVSQFGTTAYFWVDKDLVHHLITALRSDVVVIALGTNDAFDGSPERIVDSLLTLAVRAGENCGRSATCPRVVIATIPPLFQGPPFADCLPTIQWANRLLRAAWPSYLIADFDSWVTGLEWFYSDGIHLTDNGQRRRADEARNAIFRALAD